MALMGRYCKAYPWEQLKAFGNWHEKDWKHTQVPDGVASSGTDESAQEERDYYYLQENYTVTADIFIDDQIVFDAVDERWIKFCDGTLKFRESLEQAVSPKMPQAGS